MSFSSIPIKTSIPTPGTTPASADAFTYSSIDGVNTLEISGKATVGSGTLVLVRYFADLDEWRPWHEDRKITVDSSVLGGFFSAVYPVPKGDEAFVLYDSASAITATVKARRTSSPDEAVAASSGGSSGGLTDTQLRASAVPVSVSGVATAANQSTANVSLSSIDGKINTSLTVAITSVASNASSVTLLAANSSRKSASFFNADSNDLYINEAGGTATASIGGYTVKVPSGGLYELPQGANGGVARNLITGIWSSAGSAGVTVTERV